MDMSVGADTSMDLATVDMPTRMDSTPDIPDSVPDAMPDVPPDLMSDMAPDVLDMAPDVETDQAPDMPPPEGRVTDDFAGDGPLLGYVTNNPDLLPGVARVSGRYRAELLDNTGNITLHFNRDQGRLDAKRVRFPFEYIARNIGIGTVEDAQTALAHTQSQYIFAGVQVHVLDLEERNSSHVVVGHRGNTAFTIEGKNTVAGDSSVNDDGANVLPSGRADIRIVGNEDRTLTVSWQVPNPDPGVQADAWQLYRGTGSLPGSAPAYEEEVYIGLITYAFELRGVPFVGTCDGVELVGE